MHGLLRCLRVGYVDIGRLRNTVIVAGSARSGTTWVGDVIALATNSRIMFEPCLVDRAGDLALTKVRERNMADVLYDYSLYVSENSLNTNNLIPQIEQILSGKVYSTWTEQEARRGVFLRRLIKDVRISFMLGFIQNRWPTVPIIYVIRDPLDVIESQIRMAREGWSFNWKPEYVTGQPDLIKDVLERYCNDMRYDGSLVSGLINRWCVENIVACSQLNGKNNAIIVSYKELLENGKAWLQVKDFMERMNWPFSIKGCNRNLPSFTSTERQRISSNVVPLQLPSAQKRYLSAVICEYDLNKFININ